ncbi:MAG TPA: hypothetical protein DEG69_18330 [Flavobacteriaceae bacterium]|nr:hypothetical protein [Flavobacteriaceae bacterium]
MLKNNILENLNKKFSPPIRPNNAEEGLKPHGIIIQTKEKQDTNGPKTRPKQDLNKTQTRPKLDPNKTQTRPKLDLIKNISSLTGRELEMIYFIYDECLCNGNMTTAKLSIAYIESKLNSSKIALKRTIQRIYSKQLIIKHLIKEGRGGWVVYKLPNDIYSQILQSKTRPKLDLNSTETRPKLDPKLDLELDLTSPSSSGVNNINNNITTTELPEEWKTIPFYNLNKTIKLGQQQIKNIFNKKTLSADQVDKSLEAFANDMEKGLTNPNKSPLAFLMGIMLKGNPYTSVDPKFKTEEEIYIQKQMEIKIAKANEMRDMQNKAKEASYVIWLSTIGEDERDAILAKLKVFARERMSAQQKEIHLKRYHSDEIWPDEYAKMSKS